MDHGTVLAVQAPPPSVHIAGSALQHAAAAAPDLAGAGDALPAALAHLLPSRLYTGWDLQGSGLRV